MEGLFDWWSWNVFPIWIRLQAYQIEADLQGRQRPQKISNYVKKLFSKGINNILKFVPSQNYKREKNKKNFCPLNLNFVAPPPVSNVNNLKKQWQ